MNRLIGTSLLKLPLVAVFATAAQPASAQYIHMKDFPKIFGTYALDGNCERFPRVVADATGIRIVTAAGTAVFQHTDVTLGYNGREDESTTVFTQGAGEGLVLQFLDTRVISLGGERMGAAERAVDTASNAGTLSRCGARARVPAAVAAPPVPAAPRMRATAATSVAALAQGNVMTDPGFKTAYLRALGPLQREEWLIDMEGPGDQHAVTVAGGRFLEVATCKEHDCGDNAMLVLYGPLRRTLWGIVSVHQRKTLIGNPPPAIVPELRRLFKAMWPAG